MSGAVKYAITAVYAAVDGLSRNEQCRVLTACMILIGEHRWSEPPVAPPRFTPDASSPERRLGDLEKLTNPLGGEFARLDTDGDDTVFVCHRCGKVIDCNYYDPDRINGFNFKCVCGQEFIGSTHVMLHAIEHCDQETSMGPIGDKP